jgi:hypothetical protein
MKFLLWSAYSMILQEKVFFDQESIQPLLHGPSSQGEGAEGGQDNQCLNRLRTFPTSPA